jgi:hypothetical protein
MQDSVINILTLLRQKINRKWPYSIIALLSEFVKLYLAAGCWSLASGCWLLVSYCCQAQGSPPWLPFSAGTVVSRALFDLLLVVPVTSGQ